MASLKKWAGALLPRAPQVPLRFPTTGFEAVPVAQVLEEEMFDEFKAGYYYPVNIGDLFASDKYQVVGKLGFGSTSTVWRARDLWSVPPPLLFYSSKKNSRGSHFANMQGRDRAYVTLKIFARGHGDLQK